MSRFVTAKTETTAAAV